MKKFILLVMSILLISIGLFGCGTSQETIQDDMLTKLNEKYGTSFTTADIISTYVEDNNTIYYFGSREHIFDDTNIFVVVYDGKTLLDNYNACIVEDEIIDRVTKVIGKECYVYVNTAEYPISENKYTTLNDYITGNYTTISFNVYICDDGSEYNLDNIKESLSNEFGNTGKAYIEILDTDIYESVRNKDYETYYGYSDIDKLHIFTIEW